MQRSNHKSTKRKLIDDMINLNLGTSKHQKHKGGCTMSEYDAYSIISTSKEFRFISEIIDGRFDIVKRLVEQKMDIEAKYYNGVTALMVASKYNHLDTVKYLIEQKADIEAKDKYGATGLMYASNNCRLDIVKYLIEQKADIEATDDNGYTALSVYRSSKVREYLTTALAKHVEDRRQEVLRVLSPYICTDVAGVVVAYL